MTTPSTRLDSFSHGGLTFDVVDSGPLDGEVVVLLHGFPQRASSWAAVTAQLNDAGYRTIAPDQRGYSRGARPRRRFSYRLGHLVADTLSLVDALGVGPVHLVGHDWGACIAYATAARRPSAIRSLTSVSVPHPTAFVRSLLSSSQSLSSWYMAFFQLPVLPELLLTRFPAGRDRLLARLGMRPELLERFAEEIVEDGALRGAIAYYRAMPLIGHTCPVTVPTTHVWSEEDRLLLRRSAEVNARSVAAPYELVVLPGVSHWVPDDRPDDVATAVLARVRSVSRQVA